MRSFPFIFLFASIVCIKVHGKDYPNFIFILTDDQGWTSLSSAIDPNYPNAKSDYHITPNMDKLLSMGVNFSNGYAASPVCSPSRYSIQFGKSPARLRKTIVRGRNLVDHNQVGIAQVLKSINNEYLCAHLGKWHIDRDPSEYGYEINDGITTNAEGNFNYDNHNLQWGGYAEEDPKRVNSLTDRSIEIIKNALSQDRPFFIQISHYAVHSDLVYSNKSFSEMLLEMPGDLHNNISYAAMTMDLDKSIGRLLDFYESNNLSDNTYIIFTSDNGAMPVLPIQVNEGRPYKNGLNSPLVRGKWDLMEGGVRVPFFISGPGIKENQVSDTPVIAYDLYPTFVDLALENNETLEFEMPIELDGGSLFELLKTDPNLPVFRRQEGLIFHFPHYNICGLNEPHSAIRIDDYKLIKFYASNESILIDLSEDISEKKNLFYVKNDLANYLEKQLDKYLIEVNAEKPEESFTWEKNGQFGNVKTKFFQRY